MVSGSHKGGTTSSCKIVLGKKKSWFKIKFEHFQSYWDYRVFKFYDFQPVESILKAYECDEVCRSVCLRFDKHFLKVLLCEVYAFLNFQFKENLKVSHPWVVEIEAYSIQVDKIFCKLFGIHHLQSLPDLQFLRKCQQAVLSSSQKLAKSKSH